VEVAVNAYRLLHHLLLFLLHLIQTGILLELR
jgi:hypothetical protein